VEIYFHYAIRLHDAFIQEQGQFYMLQLCLYVVTLKEGPRWVKVRLFPRQIPAVDMTGNVEMSSETAFSTPQDTVCEMSHFECLMSHLV
jgi:hypothetical protein